MERNELTHEGPEITLVEFTQRMPMYLQAFVEATHRGIEEDAPAFDRNRTFEDWLRELLAYEAFSRLQELVSNHPRSNNDNEE